MGFVGGAIATALSYNLTVNDSQCCIGRIGADSSYRTVRPFPKLGYALRASRGVSPSSALSSVLKAGYCDLTRTSWDNHGDSSLVPHRIDLTDHLCSCPLSGGHGKPVHLRHRSSVRRRWLLNQCYSPQRRRSIRSPRVWVSPVLSDAATSSAPEEAGKPNGLVERA